MKDSKSRYEKMIALSNGSVSIRFVGDEPIKKLSTIEKLSVKRVFGMVKTHGTEYNENALECAIKITKNSIEFYPSPKSKIHLEKILVQLELIQKKIIFLKKDKKMIYKLKFAKNCVYVSYAHEYAYSYGTFNKGLGLHESTTTSLEASWNEVKVEY